jgi:hypothetical protein
MTENNPEAKEAANKEVNKAAGSNQELFGDDSKQAQSTRLQELILYKNKWLSLVSGLAVGIFLHYLLFRLTLPTEPFIYAAF